MFLFSFAIWVRDTDCNIDSYKALRTAAALILIKRIQN